MSSIHKRNRTSKRAEMPLPALIILLLCSGILVPLFMITNEEDARLTGTTTATQLPGGENTSYRSGSGLTRTEACRDAPVEFVAEGMRYEEVTVISGDTCLTSGRQKLEIRYNPADPTEFAPMERQYILYGLVALSAVGFLASLAALVRRLWRRRPRSALKGL